jgi:cell division protein FtsW
VWAVLSIAPAVIVYRFNYSAWRRFSMGLIVLAMAALGLVLVVGGGVARWLLDGSIQPSEPAKLAVIVYLSHWLSSKRDDLHDVWLGLVPYALVVGAVTGLIMLQPNFSTAMLIAAIAALMFYVAGADVQQMALGVGVAALAAVFLIMNAPYRLQRVRAFLDPASDPYDSGLQFLRGVSAIVRGGLAGQGLGAGRQKHFIPLAHNDSIFPVLTEELGLLGGVFVLALFAVLAWRGLMTARAAPDAFGCLLAAGLTIWLVGQAIMNVGAVTGLLPFTGQPMPFVSYGGSSLMACMTAVGMLMSVAREADPRLARRYATTDIGWRNSRARLSRARRARRLAGA